MTTATGLDASKALYRVALDSKADTWVPAGGGHEEPFAYAGEDWLYVYNPHRHEHLYLRVSTATLHDGFRNPGEEGRKI